MKAWTLLLGALSLSACSPAQVWSGLDVLVARDFDLLQGRKVGIVANHTSVDRRFEHLVDLVRRSGACQLVALFGPEHGVRGDAQAGVAVKDQRDPETGVPVYSLYGETKRPTAAMLRGIDLLVYDIQDLGVRTYTYTSTLRGVLEAAAESGIEVLVLDRAAPLDGETLEGPVLEPEQESFVGAHRLPLRYGLSAGELARLLNEERRIGARLSVLRAVGWRRREPFSGPAGLWVAPSPNIPTPLAALSYAGFVLLEATNLSEGRGTTRPFQILGAPWVDGPELARRLQLRQLAGAQFRAITFRPTFSKCVGEDCRGVELHVDDAAAFRPVLAALSVLVELQKLHPDKLELNPSTVDRLAGTPALRAAILRGEEPEAIAQSWEDGLAEFRERRAKFLLY